MQHAACFGFFLAKIPKSQPFITDERTRNKGCSHGWPNEGVHPTSPPHQDTKSPTNQRQPKDLWLAHPSSRPIADGPLAASSVTRSPPGGSPPAVAARRSSRRSARRSGPHRAISSLNRKIQNAKIARAVRASALHFSAFLLPRFEFLYC